MSDSKVTGIVGSQNQANGTATATRNARKGTFKKAYLIFPILAIILVLLNFWRTDLSVKVAEERKQARVSAQPQVHPAIAEVPAKIVRKEVAWKQQSGEILPVNVWSEKVPLPSGCRSDLTGGYGQVYVAQYWDYSTETWEDLTRGKHNPRVEELRFKVLKEGLTSLPFVIECRR